MASLWTLPSAPSPRLPFDVLEEVVGHLAIDPRFHHIRRTDQAWDPNIVENTSALKACSLACQGLLHCSRRYIFRTLHLKSAEALQRFIALQRRVLWLSGCISMLYVYGDTENQSWISALPFRLLPLLRLRRIIFNDVNLCDVHPNACKLFRLRGPRFWTFREVQYTRYSQVTQLLPANTTHLLVIDRSERCSGRGSERDFGRLSFQALAGPLNVSWTPSRRRQAFQFITSLGPPIAPRNKFKFYVCTGWRERFSVHYTAAGDLRDLFQHFVQQHRGNNITLELDLYVQDHFSRLGMIYGDSRHTLVIYIAARSLSCIATLPIVQALQQARSALFNSLQITICDENSVYHRPEVNPPLTDMEILAGRWEGIDAALARTNYPNIKHFRFECCLKPGVLPTGYSCSNELYNMDGVLSMKVVCDDPFDGFDVPNSSAQAFTYSKLPFSALERCIEYLSFELDDTERRSEAVLALKTCSVVCKALSRYCRLYICASTTLASGKELTEFVKSLRQTPGLARRITKLVLCGMTGVDQSWISVVPLRLLPLLQRLRNCTFQDVDLHLIHPSAYKVFRLYGPREWTFKNVTYSRYSQITRLLPTSTTYLCVEEPLDTLGIDAPLDPGQLSFRHIRGPLVVKWYLSWKDRESLARNLDGNALPLAGFDFYMGGWLDEHHVDVEDAAVIGCIRKVFESAVGPMSSRNADLRLEFLSKSFEKTYINMWRSKEYGTVDLKLSIVTKNLGSITTSHVAELLHHAASLVLDYFVLNLRSSSSSDSQNNSHSPNVKALVSLWECIDTALANTNYSNIRTLDFQCELDIDAVPTGYPCTNQLIRELLPSFTARVSLAPCGSFERDGRWHRCAYHGFAPYSD
ncbi:hypothetical protein EIP91_011339 [Steccherinum ochraceum]|uniref:Uncharacterized protein n=1 Tax=Steccherinum ochraceum TaxID=92696 RepID=A0A4R0R1X1_9APHY|nr:hypothetical protein EIP91_011339 [Steccherinum ochraceum]